MKRVLIAGLGVITLIATIPVVANLSQSAFAQNAQNRGLQLRLEAEKKVMQQQKTNWQALSGQAVVQPADVLRYTLSGVNNGDRPIKNLNINQPIPKGMVYVLNSATINANNGAKISYSIDNGRNFVENPTVKVTLPNGKVETLPAPATAYTHIRWNFGRSIAAKATVKGTYQVQVR